MDRPKKMRYAGGIKAVDCPCGVIREFPNEKVMNLFMKLHSKNCERMREGMKAENRIIGSVSKNIRLNRVINRYELGVGLVESNPRK